MCRLKSVEPGIFPAPAVCSAAPERIRSLTLFDNLPKKAGAFTGDRRLDIEYLMNE
jgi:hypothetical protein